MHTTTATGTLSFDPVSDGVRSRPGFAILRCGEGWFHLYGYWLALYGATRWAKVVDEDRIFGGQYVDRKPRLGVIREGFVRPNWGPHITVIRGEQPRTNSQDWGRWEGAPVTFNVSPHLNTNGRHWWLPVECDELLRLREHFGLPRRPRVELHLTVGVVPGTGGPP